MAIHKRLEPHLNACKHGYAHDLRDRLRKGLVTQEDAKQELSKRDDEKEIRQILGELKNG